MVSEALSQIDGLSDVTGLACAILALSGEGINPSASKCGLSRFTLFGYPNWVASKIEVYA